MEQPITTADYAQQQYVPRYGQMSPVISVGEWIVTSLLIMIPLVNIVLLLMWAFGSNTNPNKANWAKASLVVMAILGVTSVIFLVAINFALFNV